MMHHALRTVGTRLALTVIAAALALVLASPALSQDAPSTAPGAPPAEKQPPKTETGNAPRVEKLEGVDPYELGVPSKGSGPRDISGLADDVTLDALIQWSSKYRLGRGVQTGDWVRYESLAEPKETLEVRVESDGEGGNWIIETRTVDGAKTELHLHLAGAKMQTLGGFKVDADGNRTEIPPMDPRKVGEEVWAMRADVVASFSVVPDKIRVHACEDYEDVTVPAGTISCKCLDVQEEDRGPLALMSRQQHWISEGTKLYLSTDVPRLIPASEVFLSALLSPDDMMTVPGGLVKSHNYVLVDYSGRQ